MKWLKPIFGSANDRYVKRLLPAVKKINALEPAVSALSDEELRNQTAKLKDLLAQGKTLDDILPEAFATVREASRRITGLRPYDVQLVGGIVLHKGMIAEMKTGEGKTLMATLPVYLNALTGKGVHVVTVNDYLAQRDAKGMGKIYGFLGLTTGCILHGLSDRQRKDAYGCDITYGTNHEFGFDYLRDNMKFHLEEMVMRPFNYAIVDEVDSILIDEARTPLIISGPAEDSSDLYHSITKIIPDLRPEDYEKDEKQHSVILTEAGMEHIEELLKDAGLVKSGSLYDVQNITVVHHVHAALKAHKLYSRDVDYIVRNGEVIIIDEFTGRMMEGRRYSDGLHQAIEAKEGVKVESENQTLASITYQNFFRLYPKLSGMAGTAMTEATEFDQIYSLRTVEIPPNVPVIRDDQDDEIYLTMEQKYKAVVSLIKECQDRGQPVLVGTTSIEKSEHISKLLNSANITHQVLNARLHEKEAYIVADAGRSGVVTVATNMAGRGTDIQLGGNLEMRIERELEDMPEGEERDAAIVKIQEEILADREKVKAAGGLCIIGTERHESRRIDNQLRGRAGRQGDPGASRFFISIQDDLIRIFGATERMDAMLRRFGAKEDEVISHKWITKSIERAQEKVEARNFDIRKQLLRYDDVMNEQRKVIYKQRLEIMKSESVTDTVEDIYEEVIDALVQSHAPVKGTGDQWDFDTLAKELQRLLALDISSGSWKERDGIREGDIILEVTGMSAEHMAAKEEKLGKATMDLARKNILLRLLDQHWKDHLLALDHLRQGINLRSYAQSNPLNEYKREAFNLFQVMIGDLKADFVAALSHYDPATPGEADLEALLGQIDFSKFEELDANESEEKNPLAALASMLRAQRAQNDGAQTEVLEELDPEHQAVLSSQQHQVKSRNELCPCGSGKKYKHCHGSFA